LIKAIIYIDIVAYYTTKRSEVENLPLEMEIYQKVAVIFFNFIENILRFAKALTLS